MKTINAVTIMTCEEITLALILNTTATEKACLQTFLKAIKRSSVSRRLSFVLLQKASISLWKLPDNDKYLSKSSSGSNPEVHGGYLIIPGSGKHPFALKVQVQCFLPVRIFINSLGILLCHAFFDHSKQSRKLYSRWLWATKSWTVSKIGFKYFNTWIL